MTSWLTTAIQTVRDKSADALDFVRRDLTEFTTTVKTDTETYINKIKSQEVGDLGINQFVSKFNNPVKSESDNGQHIRASASLDRVRNEQARLQNDESTYLVDPTPLEAYENWRETSEFNVDTRKGEIAQLLIDAPHVRLIFGRLVPAATTHSDFWSRYYFRLFQIEEEEARRIQLLRRANEICSENNDNIGKNNENDWDEPEEEWSQESAKVTEESASKIEHREEEEQPPSPPSQESVAVDTDVKERKQSDAVSGDSWEREFDETDLVSLVKTDADLPIKPEEPVKSEVLSSSTTTITPSSSDKKPEHEFDDDWESWS